jgi:hypothetical protein
MKSARCFRVWLTLGVALGLAPGCRDADPIGDANVIDAHVHEHDAAVDDAGDDAAAHAHDAGSTDAGDDAADVPRDRSPDLEIRLGDWTAERGSRAEFRLVGQDDELDAIVVLRAVTTGTERFALDDVMGAAPARLEWYLDRDGDELYGPGDTAAHVSAPSAHPYLLVLTPGSVAGELAPRSSERVDLVGHLSGFAVHVGVRFELRVTTVGSAQTVAIYRDEAMAGADTLDVRVPGALRVGVAYRVFLFIDLNDNGVYDLRGDHGSGIEGTATARGLTFGHDHHTNRTWWE